MAWFGIERPGLTFASLPPLLAEAPEFESVIHPIGIATDPLLATDLNGPLISEAARTTPCRDIVAQYVVLDWLRSADHRGKNFLNYQGRLRAIDFCEAPPEDVWMCAPFEDDTPDHGDLGDLVRQCPDDQVDQVMAMFDAIDEATLRSLVADFPEGWAKPSELSSLIGKVIDRKGEVSGRYARA